MGEYMGSWDDIKLVRQGLAPLVLVLASGTTPAGPSVRVTQRGPLLRQGVEELKSLVTITRAGGRSHGRVRWSGSPLGTLLGLMHANSRICSASACRQAQ